MGFEKRVFSGVQPTGELTLGNYLGAITRFVDLQNSGDACLYCIVDLHAITVWQDPVDLRRASRHVAAAFIAAGLDPKKSIIFNQSRVSGHAELAWILNCVARIGWLNRMTQFKEKAGKNRENASVGLYGYPVLMAADILLYQATHVPVGDDQKQHLELARDVAHKFNLDYAHALQDVLGHGRDALFPLPEPLIMGPATRIMSLRDGRKKMSKSDPSDLSRISLRDDADAIAHKIRKAKTDSDPLPESEADLEGRAEARNLVGIYAALAGCSVQEVLNSYAGQNFGAFKPVLSELVVDRIAPLGAEIARLEADAAELDRILCDGGARAAAIAAPTLEAAKKSVGFLC